MSIKVVTLIFAEFKLLFAFFEAHFYRPAFDIYFYDRRGMQPGIGTEKSGPFGFFFLFLALDAVYLRFTIPVKVQDIDNPSLTVKRFRTSMTL